MHADPGITHTVVDVITPLYGPEAGGTLVTFTGGGFNKHTLLSIYFDDNHNLTNVTLQLVGNRRVRCIYFSSPRRPKVGLYDR